MMKRKLTAILIDDERLARKDMRALLAEYDTIEILGEADSVASAKNLLETLDPDLIFLDIQMPGESGFDLLEQADVRAKVIFVTAFDEYAIRAFEVDAIDYLLKPVNPERLHVAIERLERETSNVPDTRKKLTYDDSLLLSINSRLRFIRIRTIIGIQSAGDYSEVLTGDGKKGLVLKSMSEWEDRLPASHFSRIHRSTIVNLDSVERIEEWFGNSYHVYMKGFEAPFTMSRRYAALLKQKMG